MTPGAGGGVPGVWDDWVGLEGYTGYTTQPSQDPYFIIFQPQGPTHGQMKVKSSILMRFPRIGLDMGPRMTRIDPQNDPPDTLPDWSRDVPSDPHIPTSGNLCLRIGVI